MTVKELLSNKVEMGYELAEKYATANPFVNGELASELKDFFNEYFLEDLEECDDEEEMVEDIRKSLEECHHANIDIDINSYFELWGTFQDESENEFHFGDYKVTREEFESCEDVNEFNAMMENVAKFKYSYSNVGANVVTDNGWN